MSTVKELLKYLIQYRWKYYEFDCFGDKSGLMVLRWVSPNFGQYHNYWLELELLQNHPKGHEKRTVQFLWLNWDVGGGRHFIHIPDINLYQSWEELDKLCGALGIKFDVRTESDTVNKYADNLITFKRFYEI